MIPPLMHSKHWYCKCCEPSCNITMYYCDEDVEDSKIKSYMMIYPMYMRNIPLEERVKYHSFFGKPALFNYLYYDSFWRMSLWNIINYVLFKPLDIIKQLFDVLFFDMFLVYDCLPSDSDIDEIKKYDNKISIITMCYSKTYSEKQISTLYPITKKEAGFFTLLKYIFKGYISGSLIRYIENDKVDSESVSYD